MHEGLGRREERREGRGRARRETEEVFSICFSVKCVLFV